MDYSLLLGVYDVKEGQQAIGTELGAIGVAGTEIHDDQGEAPSVFRMGIIDIACEYTCKKVAAHWLKAPTLGFCCREEIDTEPPEYYSDRFVTFVDEMVVPSN